MNRITISSMIILALMGAVITRPACCQEELGGPFENTIGGKVISVDVQNSKMVVKTFENFTFSIAPDVKMIDSDGFSIQLSNIRVGDYVTVDYYDRLGIHVATNVEVDYDR